MNIQNTKSPVILKIRAQQKQKAKAMEDNLGYILQIVKQKYKVGLYSRQQSKNRKITDNVEKLEDQPMKVNIQIIAIPNRKKRKNGGRKSSVEEFKSHQRQRNINLHTAKVYQCPRTSHMKGTKLRNYKLPERNRKQILNIPILKDYYFQSRILQSPTINELLEQNKKYT